MADMQNALRKALGQQENHEFKEDPFKAQARKINERTANLWEEAHSHMSSSNHGRFGMDEQQRNNEFGYPELGYYEGTQWTPICSQCGVLKMPNKGDGMICDKCAHEDYIESALMYDDYYGSYYGSPLLEPKTIPDSTVAHITNPQFKMKGGAITQHEKAVNGKFYWVEPPEELLAAYTDHRSFEWNYMHCIMDDYGTLIPADLFAYGGEDEQCDLVISWFLFSRTIGARLTLTSLSLMLLTSLSNSVRVVDSFLNVYTIEEEDYSTEKPFIKLNISKRGPWGNVLESVPFKGIHNSGLHYLTY